MVRIKCFKCGTIIYKSPSKVRGTNFCSRECYSEQRNKILIVSGVKNRFKNGNKRPREWTESQSHKVSGTRNYAWKGQDVSYRGLHQWIRRKLGKPNECRFCGLRSSKPRVLQWANIDGRYRRDLEDYIPLCCSCHKIYDLSKKSNRGFPSAT